MLKASLNVLYGILIKSQWILTKAKKQRVDSHRVYVEEYCAYKIRSDAKDYSRHVAIV